MELDSIECVSYSDGMEDDDDAAAVSSAQLPRPFLKSASSAGSAAAAAVNVVVVSDRAGAAGGAGPGGAGAGPLVISPATGVHELLECPVCTNSMYPPIHQVRPYSFLALFFSDLGLVTLPGLQLRVIWWCLPQHGILVACALGSCPHNRDI
jgi:hypothetical protein